MPHMTEAVILRAWRMKNETGKIHYLARKADGKERHLVVKADHALYDVLDSHLLAMGYAAPASASEDESHGEPVA